MDLWASIKIGSTSVNLLVAAISEESLIPLFKARPNSALGIQRNDTLYRGYPGCQSRSEEA